MPENTPRRDNRPARRDGQTQSAGKRTLGDVFRDLVVAVADTVVDEIKDTLLPTAEVTEKGVAEDALQNVAGGVKNADGEAVLAAYVAGQTARIAVRRLKKDLPATTGKEEATGLLQRVDEALDRLGDRLHARMDRMGVPR